MVKTCPKRTLADWPKPQSVGFLRYPAIVQCDGLLSDCYPIVIRLFLRALNPIINSLGLPAARDRCAGKAISEGGIKSCCAKVDRV